MRSPYVPHTFGEEVERLLTSRLGWLTAGVVSSIPWPDGDVAIHYNGDLYVLRGKLKNGQESPPCITVPCPNSEAVNECLAKVYRLTSVLGWYFGGYVDVAGYMQSTHPILYGDVRSVFSEMGLMDDKQFNCSHLPIIEDESTRKALAFWREGRRLYRVHTGYAYLSFYKVIESQFTKGPQRAEWILEHLDKLTGHAATRVAELRALGIDVSRHLFESGRCAVAHATLDGLIVDPDVPEDRRRIFADIDVIEGLAKLYIERELGVPTRSSHYATRNRLLPWETLLTPDTLTRLKSGEELDSVPEIEGLKVSVAIWPDQPHKTQSDMFLHVLGVDSGFLHIVLASPNRSILLRFALNFIIGKVKVDLEMSGLMYASLLVTEQDVKEFANYFSRVLGNQIVELRVEGLEPVDCEVVIPVNIIPMTTEDTTQMLLTRHRVRKLV